MYLVLGLEFGLVVEAEGGADVPSIGILIRISSRSGRRCGVPSIGIRMSSRSGRRCACT